MTESSPIAPLNILDTSQYAAAELKFDSPLVTFSRENTLERGNFRFICAVPPAYTRSCNP